MALLTVEEVASVLRRSRVWVWRNADRIGCIRDGGIRFEQSAIDAWIARHRSGGVQQPAPVAERPAAKPHQLIASRRGKPNLVTGQTYGRTA